VVRVVLCTFCGNRQDAARTSRFDFRDLTILIRKAIHELPGHHLSPLSDKKGQLVYIVLKRVIASPTWSVTNEQDFDSMELMDIIQGTFDCLIRENPMREAGDDALTLDFHGTELTSGAGLPS
jgi:hypothetical protein